MGKTEGAEKNGGATKVEKEDKKHEKKEKHADMDDHEKEAGKGEEKAAKKKKDKDGKYKEDGTGKDQKKKTQDKTDPAKLKQNLEKIDVKMQALVTKREEILKLLNEVERNAANPNGGACPSITS